MKGIRKANKKIIVCLVVVFVACPLFAGVGTTGGQFLKINPSARASGLGGVSAAFCDDLFSVYSNPSGLARLSESEFSATFIRYFADVNFGHIGYASKTGGGGVFGFAYTYLIIDKIEKRDVTETRLGDFNAKDTSITAAYGMKNAAPSILENMDIGGSLKIISSEIDQTIAYTAALDISATYSPIEKLNTALVIQNISPGIKFNEVTDNLPLNLKLGVAYQPLSKLNLGAEIDEYLFDNKFYAALGAEYKIVNEMVLRLGYRFGYDTSSLGSNVGLSVGMGFRIWSVGMDYAFVPFGDLGDTHRITFLAKF